ncbi:hypothetical protein D8B26_004206 [Coccidioides posadasii str. Silveira]|uniref:cyclin-dependent kinase n=2 Tax=Coccidioides posadasii TaxID=199306 RepID=E9DCV2_COCPS|nr:kinase domain containing protein [Coccidioides posadasii C735 delta SOWgp]EER25699.1 kinase domain containing protein [Coccidioides posadasii C735 delta SOWgp]EFW16028.1 protein kinase [Coccidioides posadasii str. Silveira]QVM09549.1 hypothetical protein D8B26_004206 [Coccidioides posadasii str. Silveira]|eukprot:XP_003067844.1 kinase domain containing protein [Coccidioides posadasii C735 delta SOWgp]
MSSAPKSRWAEDDADTQAYLEQKKREKEKKKQAKAEKQRQLEEAQRRANPPTLASEAADANGAAESRVREGSAERPVKRRRLSIDRGDTQRVVAEDKPGALLQFPGSEWGPCRHVDNYERLNAIEEGSYGWVSRAKEVTSGEIVAIKKLKMDNTYDGFPITGLREIQTLQESRHPHIVRLREVVMGDTMDDVFLVMDFLEHDLKTLLDDMREPFLPSETKTLLLQIMSAAEFLHSHWIMHRDLKTSNLLMNNRGEIKLADFGMARYYGDPPPKLTQLVVTLWYRSPELLLGAEKYGPEIDIWSIGCIFGELLTKEPLLQGKNEVEQLSEIFKLTGPPNSQIWPGFRSLPNAKSLRLPPSSTTSSKRSTNVPLLPRSKFPYLTTAGLTLLSDLLALNPASRPTAKDCLSYPYFREDPKPKPKEMFPTFPSKAGMEKRRKRDTPEAPKRGEEAPSLDFANVFGGGGGAESGMEAGAGFTLRLG